MDRRDIQGHPLPMHVPLIDFLANSPTLGPARIVSGLLEQRNLIVLVRCYPWWLASRAFAEDRRNLRLVFAGISEGALDLPLADHGPDEWDDDLDELSIKDLKDVDWAQPSVHSIYAYAPTSDPVAIYRLVSNYLSSVGAAKGPEHYLHGGDRPDRFFEIFASASYLVGQGPKPVVQIIQQELERQSVPHNILTEEQAPEERLWVQWGDARFFCERAFVEFDE